ncbi:MAG: hypothetical protein ACO307_19875, partial [Ilumatobacteraceae bacterium]
PHPTAPPSTRRAADPDTAVEASQPPIRTVSKWSLAVLVIGLASVVVGGVVIGGLLGLVAKRVFRRIGVT